MRRVLFLTQPEKQVLKLHRYIAKASSADIADRYIEGLIGYCESLITFPERGARRDDIRPGLRVTHYRGKTTIAFAMKENVIAILGVFHGGQNYEDRLKGV